MNLEDYIIQTFQDHNIIGLGEGGHGLLNSHELIRQMFDNPKIQETIDIVIVEFANTGYQDVLDKYIFGEEVALNDLKKSWRETTSPGRLGELPIYFELLKKIREVNQSLPQNKKIRVLAGNPSIDWSVIHTREEWQKQVGYRQDIFPAELAIEFGINQDKKVLVIYSEIHLTKIANGKFDPNYQSITSLVNKTNPNAMKVVGTIYSNSFLNEIPDSRNWPLNSIFNLSKDRLGNLSASQYFSSSLYKDAKEITVFDGYEINSLFDALLYVGQFDSLKRCPMPEPDFDPEYLIELNRRRKIVGMMPIG